MSSEEKKCLDEGIQLLKLGDFERAEEIFKSFLSDYPESDLADNACYNLAQIYKKKKNYVKALQVLEYLLRHYPESDAAYFAKDEVEELKELINGQSVGTEEELFKQGVIAFEKGDLSKAEQSFLKFIEVYPSSSLADNAIYNLILIYQKQGDMQKVQYYLEKLEKEYPYSDGAFMARYTFL